MSTHRAHIALPTELLAEIDAAVGPRKRSAFITRLAETELRKMRQLNLLKEFEEQPAWKAEDHPELANGSANWVRTLRKESDRRFDAAERQRRGRSGFFWTQTY